MMVFRAEDAVPVYVHRHHPAMLANVAAQKVHVCLRGLRRVESRQDLARRVVYHHQQDHARPPAFQPLMMAAVRLHQLTTARAALPPAAVLLHPALALPQALRHEPFAQRANSHCQTLLTNLLRCKGRPESRQFHAVVLYHLLAVSGGDAPIRGPPPQLVDDRRVPFSLQLPLDAADLPL